MCEAKKDGQKRSVSNQIKETGVLFIFFFDFHVVN